MICILYMYLISVYTYFILVIRFPHVVIRCLYVFIWCLYVLIWCFSVSIICIRVYMICIRCYMIVIRFNFMLIRLCTNFTRFKKYVYSLLYDLHTLLYVCVYGFILFLHVFYNIVIRVYMICICCYVFNQFFFVFF